MQEDNNIKEIKVDGQKIVENVELNFLEALIPVILLMGMLAYNIFFVDKNNDVHAFCVINRCTPTKCALPVYCQR